MAVLRMCLARGKHFFLMDFILLCKYIFNKFNYIEDHLEEIFLFIQIGRQDSTTIDYLIFINGV